MTDDPRDVPVDPAIPEGHHVQGVSTLVAPDGSTRIQWVKTSKTEVAREEALRRILREIPAEVTARVDTIPVPRIRGGEDTLAVYPLGDPHIGMYAWGAEAGDDFDLAKAERLFCGAIDELVGDGPPADQALIVNLGDFYHADDPSNQTPRGKNALDVDSRWMKVHRAGAYVMIYLIDRCLEAHKTVRVINETGNHDPTSSLLLSVHLDAYYRLEERVTVDLSPKNFHYYRFGANLIGVTHGDKVKLGDLESIMAADRPEDWGETRHRVWLTGHVHHRRAQEFRGCTVESFRTLAAKDAWHAAQGYRSERDVCRIAYDRNHGEVSRQTVSAAYLEELFRVGIAPPPASPPTEAPAKPPAKVDTDAPWDGEGFKLTLYPKPSGKVEVRVRHPDKHGRIVEMNTGRIARIYQPGAGKGSGLIRYRLEAWAARTGQPMDAITWAEFHEEVTRPR